MPQRAKVGGVHSILQVVVAVVKYMLRGVIEWYFAVCGVTEWLIDGTLFFVV
jgi:hypothetical protein